MSMYSLYSGFCFYINNPIWDIKSKQYKNRSPCFLISWKSLPPAAQRLCEQRPKIWFSRMILTSIFLIWRWVSASSLTSARAEALGTVVHILIDGTLKQLLLTAQLPRPEDVTHTVMQVRILTLREKRRRNYVRLSLRKRRRNYAWGLVVDWGLFPFFCFLYLRTLSLSWSPMVP